MKKELGPGAIAGAIVVMLLVIVGVYMLFFRGNTGPNNMDKVVPGKIERPPVAGGGGS